MATEGAPSPTSPFGECLNADDDPGGANVVFAVAQRLELHGVGRGRHHSNGILAGAAV